MNKFKVAILVAFIAGVVASLAGEAFGYPPFLVRARKFGAKDCTFCHVHPDGGPPFNPRGMWLIGEKDRRKADTVDVEWLTEYKPEQSNKEGGKGTEQNKGAEQNAASEKADPVAQELMKLEHDWMEALKRGDSAAVGSLLADELIVTDEEGRVINKAQYLADEAKLKVASYSFNDVVVRAHKDTAIVSFRLSFSGSYDGADISGDYRETDVWMKRDGRWQVIAVHITRLKK